MNRVVLLTAKQAMSIHVKTNGQMMLCRNGTPKNVRMRLNQIWPGEFTSRAAKGLLEQIEAKFKELDDARQDADRGTVSV